jgi:hypothetical protein
MSKQLVCASAILAALAALALSTFSTIALADECVSDNPAVTAMRSSWNTPTSVATAGTVSGAFDTVHVTLQPYDKAAARYGQLASKPKKDIKYFDRFTWNIPREGDYWIAADSGVWIDVSAASGDQAPLEPVTFNHGLRCAGIFKAVKFHLSAGAYRLEISSETTDSVKFASRLDGG